MMKPGDLVRLTAPGDAWDGKEGYILKAYFPDKHESIAPDNMFVCHYLVSLFGKTTDPIVALAWELERFNNETG